MCSITVIVMKRMYLIWITLAAITNSPSKKGYNGLQNTEVYFLSIIQCGRQIPSLWQLSPTGRLRNSGSIILWQCPLHSRVFFGIETLRETSMKRAHLPLKSPSSKVTCKLPLTNRWLELSCILCQPAGAQERSRCTPNKKKKWVFWLMASHLLGSR